MRSLFTSVIVFCSIGFAQNTISVLLWTTTIYLFWANIKIVGDAAGAVNDIDGKVYF
jgi:hypothetical protein